MKDKLRKIDNFQFYDSTGIETHLEKMASEGWMLESLGIFGWAYRRIEPKRLNFAVTYFPDASDFDPIPTDNQETYFDYCQSAGWQLIANRGQMQIFFNEAENPVSIETDPQSRLDTIHRSMKKSFLPSSLALIVCAVLQLVIGVLSFKDDPLYSLSSGIAHFNLCAWLILGGFMTYLIFSYYGWRKASLKSVSAGGDCIPVNSTYRRISAAVFALILVLLVLFLFTGPSQAGIWGMFFGVVFAVLTLVLLFSIRNALKRAKASKRTNMIITFSASLILPVLLLVLVVFLIITGDVFGDSDGGDSRTVIIELPSGETEEWVLENDRLPLIVEDMMEIDFKDYSYEKEVHSTLLLTRTQMYQDAPPVKDTPPQLNYEISQVKLPFLFEICLNAYLGEYDEEKEAALAAGTDEYRQFREMDSEEARSLWHADAAYRVYDGERPCDTYLICYGQKLVKITFYWTPTQAGLAVASEKLKTA